MQIAHPLIAEGVDQHSDFRADPWRRLQMTLRSYNTIVYGTIPAARAEIRRLNELHRSVAGRIRDPAARQTTGAERYAARDPELSLWVHATLIDATLVAHDAWVRPLPQGDRARFYAETRPIGRGFGIPDHMLPVDLAGFEAYLDEQLRPSGPIHVTPTARELAQAILEPSLAPLHPWLATVPAAAYSWLLWPAMALLPERIRSEFGLPWGMREQAIAAWLVAGFRVWRPLLPASWRSMPQALSADRRVASVKANPDRS